MLNINQITKYYPEHLHAFKSFILREYLQHKILEIIFNSKFAKQLSFIGGTNLRIVHQNTRFSEDLDFDNFNLTITEFKGLSKLIAHKLSLLGYDIEIKNVIAGAFHCYIRFPKLLYNQGLTGHIEQKILIQIDTKNQSFPYKPDLYILNKFDVFTEIFVTPKPILLAQKFYAILNRKRKKGRDFFDVLLLLKDTKPDYNYLNNKANINNNTQLINAIIPIITKLDMKEMVKDVSPFLFYNNDKKNIMLFKNYFLQVFND